MVQAALKYDLEVSPEGRLELRVPFPPGVHVTVFVIVEDPVPFGKEPSDGFDDLVIASQSSLDFWDNPFDDEDWNNA